MSRSRSTASGARVYPACHVSAATSHTAREIISQVGLRRLAVEGLAMASIFVVLAGIWIGSPA